MHKDVSLYPGDAPSSNFLSSSALSSDVCQLPKRTHPNIPLPGGTPSKQIETGVNISEQDGRRDFPVSQDAEAGEGEDCGRNLEASVLCC